MAESATAHLDTTERRLSARRLGRYRIRRALASGGMATVFVASADGHEGFQKLIALKVMHDHLATDPAYVEMFLAEARVAARIEHANVCSVFDFGESDGTYYIAMEHLTGMNLAGIRDEVRRRPYDVDWPAMAASMMVQACEGLHAAHNLVDARGLPMRLVHRDVSPQNLFLTFTGTVKIVDFGIARAADDAAQVAPGALKGKYSYLAPEQLTRPELVDRRADVWALGVTLWELLALRPLFRRSSPSTTLASVMNEPIPAPSTCQPLVPGQLDVIVAKALNRDVTQRYATARELGRDLAAYCRSIGAFSGACEIDEWLESLLPKERARRVVHWHDPDVELEERPSDRTSDPTLTMAKDDPAIVVPSDPIEATGSFVRETNPGGRPRLGRRLVVVTSLALLLAGVGMALAHTRAASGSDSRASDGERSHAPR